MLIFRDETERAEVVEMGVVKLVVSDYERISYETQNLLDDEDE